MISKLWRNADHTTPPQPRRPMTRSEMRRAISDTGWRELDWAIGRIGRRIVWLRVNRHG